MKNVNDLMRRFFKTFMKALLIACASVSFLGVSNLIVGVSTVLGQPWIGLFVLFVWFALVGAACIHLFVDSDFF